MSGCENVGDGSKTHHSNECRGRFEVLLMDDEVLRVRVTFRELRKQVAAEVEEPMEVDVGAGVIDDGNRGSTARECAKETPPRQTSSSSSMLGIASGVEGPAEVGQNRSSNVRMPREGQVGAKSGRRKAVGDPREMDEEEVGPKKRRLCRVVKSCRKGGNLDTSYENFKAEDQASVMCDVINMMDGKGESLKPGKKHAELMQMLFKAEMPSRHESEAAMDTLYAGLEFLDDVHSFPSLDRKRVIRARMEEIRYFRRMKVYSKSREMKW